MNEVPLQEWQPCRDGVIRWKQWIVPTFATLPAYAKVLRKVRRDHGCAVEGCLKVVPAKMLMCREHWYMVPDHLQKRIWKYYRPGQEKDGYPSRGYVTAVKEAGDLVKAIETPDAARELQEA